MDLPYQPLRIPTGWLVEWNTLFEEDLTTSDRAEHTPLGASDLLFMRKDSAKRAIDVEWWLGSRSPVIGEYRLRILKYVDAVSDKASDVDWESPTYTYETSSRTELVRKLEECLDRV